MKFHCKKITALLLAASVGMTLAVNCSLPAVSAAGKQLSLADTRYRYPILRMENANFSTGVSIDSNQKTVSYLTTKVPAKNGKTENNLFFAAVENYDLYKMKLGNNRALHVVMADNTSSGVADDYIGYNIHFGADVGTSEKIFPDNLQGIPETATDSGIMFHVEITGTGKNKANGFTIGNADENGKITSYSYHAPRIINCTFQEWDYKADGKVKKKAGEVQTTAMHVRPGAHVTLIWTKDIAWKNPDEGKNPAESQYIEQALETNGKPIKNDKKEDVYRLIPSYSHKAGEVQDWEIYTYDWNGEKQGGGTINLPRDFCGYVIIPFASFKHCWDSGNSDGYINFKKMELANLYIDTYWQYQGEYWIDEYCFFGPTFAKINNAYDYGAGLSIANHRDSLTRRKLITVQTASASSVAPKPPVTITAAVTLTNTKAGIVLKAPTTAKIAKNTVLSVDPADTTSDYMKQLFAKLFGDDTTAYQAYNVYLGKNGDQEPADYVQLDFPVPEGFDATKCAVYTVEDEQKKDCAATLSADKKTLSIKTMNLGLFVITKDGGNAVASEAATSLAESTSAAEDDTAASAAVSAAKPAAGGNLLWLWIVLAAVVVLGGGGAAFFLLRRKKTDSDDPNTPDASDDSDGNPPTDET